MASRTQIVCLCEGQRGASPDEVFINKLMKALEPSWLRPWRGSNVVRIVSCGNRNGVVKQMPAELKLCLLAGGQTTLMVWADCDDDCADPEALKAKFWQEAEQRDVTRAQFEQVVFIFAKDRIENWIQFLATGTTDESQEGPRIEYSREAADAARNLADLCHEGRAVDGLPPSLRWSCKNWRQLVERVTAT